MTLVSVRKTEKYDEAVLYRAIAAHFEALGFEKDLHPGLKVLIKPNLLAAHPPEKAATTHPALVKAVALWLRERGIDTITVADSPGGLFSHSSLRAVYETCGYTALQEFAALNDDTGYTTIRCPDSFSNQSFNILNPIAGADIVINIAKLKTHSLTTFTGGVKNLFGAIPGLQKPEFHYKYAKLDDFCQMLLELAQTVRPQMTVIDAVDTMEGNGPLNGRIRYMGLTLASRDVFAQDWVAASLMGLDPETTPIVRRGIRAGLIKPEEIVTVGDKAEPADPPYILPESVNKGGNRIFLLRSLGGVVKTVIRPVPAIDETKCRGCGKCAESCPMKLIKIENKKAGMQVKNCISCFCCQEMCPFDAVRVRHVIRLPKL
jgi:uncharacterized protein (DUF362 family)/NAD-dependent dihydropyrimidine dehydrogenase PreA subunit